MNKHPTPLAIRRSRKQELRELGSFGDPEMEILYKKRDLFTGYMYQKLNTWSDSVKIEVYHDSLYMLPRPNITVVKNKYAVAAAVRKLIAKDKIIWNAADKMCEALGLKPTSYGMYPFGSQMLPTGVIGAGMGMYVGPTMPEQHQMRFWMYKHALAIKAAQDVFNGQ